MSAVAERGVVAQLKEEVVEDDGVLAHHGREEEAVADGGEARSPQEGHEEAEAEENHDADVAKEGIEDHLLGRIDRVGHEFEPDGIDDEEEGLEPYHD